MRRDGYGGIREDLFLVLEDNVKFGLIYGGIIILYSIIYIGSALFLSVN